MMIGRNQMRNFSPMRFPAPLLLGSVALLSEIACRTSRRTVAKDAHCNFRISDDLDVVPEHITETTRWSQTSFSDTRMEKPQIGGQNAHEDGPHCLRGKLSDFIDSFRLQDNLFRHVT
ncbi:hypothetical protein K474DRAFT_656372 [Panus rudis PR-1116 ss-1]|nr:hypothetical protein K474DRAFT_656372 [Panus rudis PR-1116 ss-1]